MKSGKCSWWSGLLRFPESEGPDGEEPDRAAPPLQALGSHQLNLVQNQCFGSRLHPDWIRIQMGPDPGGSKLSRKKGKIKISSLKSSLLGWILLLEPECPLSGFKKTYGGFWKKIFCHKNLGLDQDPDSATAWIRSRNQWIRIRNTVQNKINLDINAPSRYMFHVMLDRYEAHLCTSDGKMFFSGKFVNFFKTSNQLPKILFCVCKAANRIGTT